MRIFITLIILILNNYAFANEDRSMSNSFYNHFVLAGGPVVWFVLVPMSIITIYLGFDLAFSIRRKKITPFNISDELISEINQNPNQQWLIQVNKRNDFISQSVVKIMRQTHLPRTEIERLLQENIEQQAFKILRKIEWSNIVGNVAPMIGLFGTVFGMIKAFNGIVIAGGQPQPAHLAEGISLALVTTFWGLLVAIPALSIAGIFRNRLETLTALALNESENIIPALRQSLKVEKDYIRKAAQNKNPGQTDHIKKDSTDAQT